MTEVTTIQQAYNLMTAPMQLHKFELLGDGKVAFVLAETPKDAYKLIHATTPAEHRAKIKHVGTKKLHELKPCIMLNQFPEIAGDNS